MWFAQFSPDGRRLVTVSRDYTARIWSREGEPIAVLHHRAPVEYADFSPDGTRVVTASGDRTSCLWNAATGRQLTEPLVHDGLVTTACFSPDGLRVLTASDDHTAQVWDAGTGLRLGEPFRHGDRVVTAKFSDDGRKAITASLDKTAKIWDVPVAVDPIPEWLPELAEAVGGRRLTPEGIPQLVPWTEQAALMTRLPDLPASDALGQVIRKLLADDE